MMEGGMIDNTEARLADEVADIYAADPDGWLALQPPGAPTIVGFMHLSSTICVWPRLASVTGEAVFWSDSEYADRETIHLHPSYSEAMRAVEGWWQMVEPTLG